MKTFNEFINEGQQFLRSVGVNDNIQKEKTFRELRNGDIAYLLYMDEKYCAVAQRMFCDDFEYVFSLYCNTDEELQYGDLDSYELTKTSDYYGVKYKWFTDYQEFKSYAMQYRHLDIKYCHDDSNEYKLFSSLKTFEKDILKLNV